MYIIGANKIGVSFGDKVLLEDVTFYVNQGEKVSIVGVNGAGKTTLMRLLYDSHLPYSGNIYLAKGKSIGHLEQQHNFDPEKTVFDAALDVFKDLTNLEKQLEKLAEQMHTDHSEANIAKYTSLQQRFEASGGYEYKSRAKGTLINMGFTEDKLQLKIAQLSGGQKTILQLALLLLDEPDILLLDEPTNHLDIRALEWLEDKLKKIRSTVLLISHDRLFLDRVTTKTLEIENTHAKLYDGSYSVYREKKKQEREIQERHYKNQQKEIARIEAFIEQQKRWNREKNIIAAESRQKALDRMEKIEKPENLPDALSFQFHTAIESGNDVLSIKNLSKAYDKKALFSDLSLEIKKKDRLVIMGANGSGKSTLLQILAGNLSPDQGNFHFGYNVRLGYYDQYQNLMENGTVLEEIWDNSNLNHTQIRSLLAGFLFKGDDVFKEIRVLSGGERARLVLAKLMQKKVNLLLLDEPTNHLDIESKEALENALLSFDGTIIAVSHDRYFLRKIGTRILNFEGNGKVWDYHGDYDSFQEYAHQKNDSVRIENAGSAKNQDHDWAKQKKQKQDEKKRLARLKKIETELEKIETRMQEIDQLSLMNASDYVMLQTLFEEKEALQKQSDALFSEWSDLEE